MAWYHIFSSPKTQNFVYKPLLCGVVALAGAYTALSLSGADVSAPVDNQVHTGNLATLTLMPVYQRGTEVGKAFVDGDQVVGLEARTHRGVHIENYRPKGMRVDHSQNRVVLEDVMEPQWTYVAGSDAPAGNSRAVTVSPNLK
ncbi:MAG: hypothetical protein ABII01_02285 [Candidatus Woesearchaeota archaeon]